MLAFLRSEAAGGLLLILASAAALLWSNSAWAPAYHWLLEARLGGALPVHSAVNDGLMALFFLLAGLEIRREVTRGRLASLRGMAAPGVAALGGMVVPAAIYMALNHGDARGLHGWAIPVATDIAFSLAVLRLLGRRTGASLRVFLTALAILDDLGAILVIALFYAQGLHWPALGASGLVCAGLAGLRRAGIVRAWPYVCGGALMWGLVYASGVHATIAGVALAFVVPRAVADRMEHRLTDVVAYGVLPAFGVANAGLDLSSLHASILLTPAPLGVLLGLCVGKQLGVFGTTMLGRRLGILRLPGRMGVRQLYGGALLCGIGFTMSLFIGDLAFRGGALHDGVKLAVFAASLLSALLGGLVLCVRAPRRRVR